MSECNVLSVSGGKDSTAMSLLALELNVANLHFIFADTGHEHAETYKYLDYLEVELDIVIHRLSADFTSRIARKREYVMEHWADDGVPQAHIDQAVMLLQPTGIPMLDLCIWKGRFPSTRRRFCSTELKHIPLEAYTDDLLDQYDEVISWQGVRRDESAQRFNLIEEEDHPTKQGLVWYRPILDWTAEDCFAMHKKYNVKPNPLYMQGMGRVGCMPCIHATKEETFQIALRFPEELERLKQWEKLVGMTAKRGVSTFFDARVTNRFLGLPKITKENVHKVSAETHGVAAYVDWATTKYGGKEKDLIKVIQLQSEDAPMCKSMYGLCE